MAKIDGLLELANNIIPSIVHNKVKINKATLTHIHIYLQDAQEKNEFLQLKSYL